MRRALSFILIRRGNIALRRKAHFRRILRFPVPIGSVTGTFLSSPQLLHSSLSHSYSLSPVSTLSTSAFSFRLSAIQCCSHSRLTSSSLNPVLQSTSKLHCTPPTARPSCLAVSGLLFLVLSLSLSLCMPQIQNSHNFEKWKRFIRFLTPFSWMLYSRDQYR